MLLNSKRDVLKKIAEEPERTGEKGKAKNEKNEENKQQRRCLT